MTNILKNLQDTDMMIANMESMLAVLKENRAALYRAHVESFREVPINLGSVVLIYSHDNAEGMPVYRGDFQNGYTLSVYIQVSKYDGSTELSAAYFRGEGKHETAIFDEIDQIFDGFVTLDQLVIIADRVAALPE